MVAITVVLAAVLYVMVSGLIGNPSAGSKPTVSLTQVNKLSNGMDILVAGITPTAAPSNFKVNIENVSATAFGTAVAAPLTTTTPVTVTVGTQTFTIAWQNPGGSGQISQGDHFVVTSSSIKAGTGINYAFLLIWSDGSTLTTSSWQA
jgi:FlaG/FlaF family flagellin (archaellin)